MKKIYFITLLLCFSVLLQGQQTNNFFKKTAIHGAIRGKYENNTSTGNQRFQIRNARVNFSGQLNKLTSYKAELDFSNQGRTQVTNVFLKFTPNKWFNLTLGQQKIPFGTANLRGPASYYFANRSFVGKQLTRGMRDVGIMATFSNKKYIPIQLKAGVFNGDGVNSQPWQKDMTYAVKMIAFPVKKWQISLNYSSIEPFGLRMNLFDFGTYYDLGNLHLEAEYVHKTYEDKVFDATNSFSTFMAYNIMLNRKNIKKITPLIRYDMMTDNNRGQISAGKYLVDDVERQRITSGLTISLDKPFVNDIRINYEHYMYKDGVVNGDNKFVIEYVVKF